MPVRDEHFMRRCLELARLGYGQVKPNPMVGAVVVKDGTIVGEGYHKRFGGEHAEVVALREAGTKAQGATLYVNLEPCNHVGKTPPCTSAIREAGIAKVVYAVDDPNPTVTGNGRGVLESAGITVERGILSEEAAQLNEYFLFAMKTQIPFVILKSGVTLDGYIADTSHRSKWITNEASRARVQEIRTGVDAVLVGANTVIHDDPRLSLRGMSDARQPYRVILDQALRTPLKRRVFTDELREKTILVTSDSAQNVKKVRELRERGVEVIQFRPVRANISIRKILRYLWKKEITSILVEGGSTVFRSFIEAQVYTKVMVFVAPKLIGGGVPFLKDLNRSVRRPLRLHNIITESLDGDTVIMGYSPQYIRWMNEIV